MLWHPFWWCYLPYDFTSCLWLYQNMVDVYWLVHSTTALGTDKASHSTGCHFDMAQIHFQRQDITLMLWHHFDAQMWVFFMSRWNATFWSKVGEMGVGETGVGEQGITPFSLSSSPALSLFFFSPSFNHPPPSFFPSPSPSFSSPPFSPLSHSFPLLCSTPSHLHKLHPSHAHAYLLHTLPPHTLPHPPSHY